MSKKPLKIKLKYCVEYFVYCMARFEMSNNSKRLFTFQDERGNAEIKASHKFKLSTF